MSSVRYPFRNPSAAAPALAFAQSYWALGSRSLSIEQSLESSCHAGFRFLEAGLTVERMSHLRRLLNAIPLRLIAQGWAATAVEAAPFLERAAELNAVCINFHLGDSFLSVPQAVDLIGNVSDQASAFRLPLLLETHRGRLTQDLARTAEIVAQLPDLALTLDVSHYLVAGEATGGNPARFAELCRSLASRAVLIHGRISDGQSIQVRSADPYAQTAFVTDLWVEAMRHWLQHAPPEALLIFEPELGPPPYAACDRENHELFDRTAETETLVALAQQCWHRATRLAKPVLEHAP